MVNIYKDLSFQVHLPFGLNRYYRLRKQVGSGSYKFSCALVLAGFYDVIIVLEI